nr:hypothetical protein [Tanacetum cinerariifolium]
DDTDDELEDQELEAHYMYMAQLQEVSPDVADSGPIFDDEPLQKVSNDDHYNVFAMESAHPEQSKPNDDDNDLATEQLARRNSKEYFSQMELECAKVREMKDKLSAHQETISILSQQKEAQIKLYKTQEDKELDKVIELEHKVKAPQPPVAAKTIPQMIARLEEDAYEIRGALVKQCENKTGNLAIRHIHAHDTAYLVD